jgi:uncharacterized protein (DUF2132 family)
LGLVTVGGKWDLIEVLEKKITAMPFPEFHPRDPLHGITLERVVTDLVEKYGWEEMGRRVRIRCFEFDPSIRSSLKFLRKTPWARQKVEAWWIADFAKREG